MSSDPPYRLNVGIALFNRKGKVWAGKRAGTPETRPDETDSTHLWQMPQGGIDANEDPLLAAKRELYEETNVSSIEYLAETDNWFTYELPREIIQKKWISKYRGQKQKWFAFLLTGNDSEIDVLTPAGGAHEAEFSEWRWEDLNNMPELIVPFKKHVYEQVATEFAPLVRVLTV